MANGTSVASIPASDTTSGPSRGDIWVNGLWFVSLTLSLSTALLAVLVRQWLHQYTAITSGTSRDRSLIRQYRYDGLIKWRVPVIISLLPILLHIALGLFLVGLTIFLHPLNLSMTWTVGSITCLVYAIYAVSNILPLFDPQCPYRTPFSDILHRIISSFWHIMIFVVTCPTTTITSLWSSLLHFFQHLRSLVRHLPSQLSQLGAVFKARQDTSTWLPPLPGTTPPGFSEYHKEWLSLKEIERKGAATEETGVRAIAWLLVSTSNPPATSIALQSLGAFSLGVSAKISSMVPPDTFETIHVAIQQIESSANSGQLVFKAQCLERLSRSYSLCDNHRPWRQALRWHNGFYPDLWESCMVSSDIPTSAKVSLTQTNILATDEALPGWQIQFLLLHTLDSSTGGPLFPAHLLATLQTKNIQDFQMYHKYLDSPAIMQQLYRFAFTPFYLPKEDKAFHVKVTSIPKELMQSLALAMVLRSPGNYCDRSIEEKLNALWIISNDIWSSFTKHNAPLSEVTDHLAGVWNTISYDCRGARGIDISHALSKTLFKHAASIIKFLLGSTDAKLSDSVVSGIGFALQTLGGEVKSLTYVELFQEQEADSREQSGLLFEPQGAAYIWTDALATGTAEAYKYFMQHGLLGQLSQNTLSDSWLKHGQFFNIILPAFINGLTRHSVPTLENECRVFLFQPDHLFAACAGFGAVTQRYHTEIQAITRHHIISLVNLDPEHPSWAERASYLDTYASPGTSDPNSILNSLIVQAFRLVDEALEAQKAKQPIVEKLTDIDEHSAPEPRDIFKFIRRIFPRNQTVLTASSSGTASQSGGNMA
ncbi:hypothetical protein HGRIS_007552 [Hohenbuehelia grisea]|uniref:DUF6535 domain-containing protein n=1 Tax=Hohenbuehelia grisea TaxID=104357 RepID=A0ABR3J6M0_9AGAR